MYHSVARRRENKKSFAAAAVDRWSQNSYTYMMYAIHCFDEGISEARINGFDRSAYDRDMSIFVDARDIIVDACGWPQPRV